MVKCWKTPGRSTLGQFVFCSHKKHCTKHSTKNVHTFIPPASPAASHNRTYERTAGSKRSVNFHIFLWSHTVLLLYIHHWFRTNMENLGPEVVTLHAKDYHATGLLHSEARLSIFKRPFLKNYLLVTRRVSSQPVTYDSF